MSTLPPSAVSSSPQAFEIFLSYARKDNVPKPEGTKGWMATLRDQILTHHHEKTTDPLRFFFDQEDIQGMQDWRHRILTGLQQSRILLVCLSPNYFRSDNCLWEWEEFHRHQAARRIGHESVAPVYFVEAPGTDEHVTAAFQAFVNRGHYRGDELEKFIPRWSEWHRAIRRFNHYDFRPWFDQGVNALAEEAVQRRLDELAGHLTDRIARTRRASGVPNNLLSYNPHFVGRTQELVTLHETLLRDGSVGVITAVNGLGGQGKTEFAISYAHAHADSYPAGLWVLNAEGAEHLLPLLGTLADTPDLGIPSSTGPEETSEQRGYRVLAQLEAMASRAYAQDPDGGASCLVILDNVSSSTLLAKTQRGLLPEGHGAWLRLVATTRLGEHEFGTGALAFLPVGSLLGEDAVDLIRNHQPPLDANGLRRDFPAATQAEDTAAAREIVRELGGFTLGVESVAVSLGLHPHIRPAGYFSRLRAEGLTSVDVLSADTDVADEMHHREKQLAIILEQTLKSFDADKDEEIRKLAPAIRTVLEHASLLPPDSIPWPWLHEMVARQHPELREARPGYPDPWLELRRLLEGRRLLTPGDHEHLARMHRMVGDHLRNRIGEALPIRLHDTRNVVENFAIALQDQMQHSPAEHRWQLAPLKESVRHWARGPADVILAHLAGVAGGIEATIGRMDEAGTMLDLYFRIAEQQYSEDLDNKFRARDLSVSLERLADFLARRGQPGDADAALAHYQRALEKDERLLAHNPGSAEASRDLMVSLGRLANILSAEPGQDAIALAMQMRALAIAVKLHQDNPASAYHGRTAAASFFLAARRAQAAGDQELAHRLLNGCFMTLDEMVQNRLQLDAPMLRLHAQLKATFDSTP